MKYLMILAFMTLYMLPWILAKARRHRQSDSIAIVTVFLGWTGIGWVIALAWAASADVKPRAPTGSAHGKGPGAVAYRFVGEDGSLGYRKGLVYRLVFVDARGLGAFAIQREDGSGWCPYRSPETFAANWAAMKEPPPGPEAGGRFAAAR